MSRKETLRRRDYEQMLARELAGEHIQQRIHYGIPEIGWDGDPWLSLYYNKLQDAYEVWDEKDEPVLIARRPAETMGRIEEAVVQLCVGLRDHDFRKFSAEQIAKRVSDHNDRIRAEESRRLAERREAASDRLAHALRKDLGHLY
jgi:hypothetical protein